jgi:hypothetical protein
MELFADPPNPESEISMAAVPFDRDATAKFYAKQHLKIDPGVQKIYYLRTDAPDREIRFVEINSLLAEMKDETLEPLDFGVDRGTDVAHKLIVLDVTPSQWKSIERGALPLPDGWKLEDAEVFSKKAKRR